MASHQIWKNEKKSVLLVKQTFSLIFQLWRLAILKPVGVKRSNVPHFKGLIMHNLDFEAQGHGSTFTFCHGHLKKAISLGKPQKVGLFCKGLYVFKVFKKCLNSNCCDILNPIPNWDACARIFSCFFAKFWQLIKTKST